MNEIESSSRVVNVMAVTSVLNIEVEKWGAISILRKVDYGVYICTYSVQYEDYQIKKKHEFLRHLIQTFHQPKCCGAPIDNRVYAHVCVIYENVRESKQNLKKVLKHLFDGLFHI